MAAIIRFFSRRFGRKKADEQAPSHMDEAMAVSKTKKTKKSDLGCRVTYLDSTEQTFYLPKNADASQLFDIAFAYIGVIEERDYFGLKYCGKQDSWLDPTKSIRKQCEGSPPYNILFRVKFFASDPHHLRDEYTRYLVVLQLREAIHTGQLKCPDTRLASELAALLLQAEFGDFDPRQHTPVFVSTFRFLPEAEQTEQFELDVLAQYRALANRNLTPADAEALYLEKARHIPTYGIDMHTVRGKDNQDYNLGLTPTGILVYQGDSKIGLFFWPNILTIAMNGQKLKIVVAEENETTRQVTEHSFCFVLPNKSACKNLWKSAVEHHTFFRLTDRSQPPPKRKQLFRLRSRFHASFRTEYQLQNPDLFGSSSFRKKKKPVSSGMSSPTATSPPPSSGDRFGKLATPGITRTASSFRRTPSKRFNSRPSFSNRSALEERRAKRHRVPPSEETLQSNAFDKARTVVNVERACLRDPNWVPSGSPGSSGTGPRIRTRPVEYPPKSSPTPSPIAVRVTPQLSRRQAPSSPVKSASKPNGAGVPVNRCPAEECFEVTV